MNKQKQKFIAVMRYSAVNKFNYFKMQLEVIFDNVCNKDINKFKKLGFVFTGVTKIAENDTDKFRTAFKGLIAANTNIEPGTLEAI